MAINYYYLCQYAIKMGSDFERQNRREINVANKMALIYLIKIITIYQSQNNCNNRLQPNEFLNN